MSIDAAVVGCGYWGRNLVRNFDATSAINLVAVCDVMSDRVEAIGKEYPQVVTSTDCDAVLDDPSIDAVAIATPISTHHLIARKALLAGKHVFVEKPLAMQSEDVRELILISQEMGKLLMVDDIFLYNGRVRAVKELVDRNELGDIYYVDAVRVNLNDLKGMGRSTGFYSDASVVWDLAPHDVAMMISFVDAEPVRVAAMGRSPFIYCAEDFPAMAWASITFENGVVGHIHVNWLAPEQLKRMVIAGSKKMVVYDDLNHDQPITLYDKGVDLFPQSTSREPKLVRYREGETKSVPWDDTESLRVAVRHFRNSILEGREPLTGASFALKVVGVLEAIERSISMEGEPVDVKLYSTVRG